MPESRAAVPNSVFVNHIQWKRKDVAGRRIVFVWHVGDIVDRDNDEPWALPRTQLDLLRDVVSFGLVVGNHNLPEATGDRSRFQRCFAVASSSSPRPTKNGS